MPDLWPTNIENNRVNSPVVILREQAALLGEKTKNIVMAAVVEGSAVGGGLFAYDFFIVGPALQNYRYRLLTIFHDVALYPVKVFVEEDILSEVVSAHSFTKAKVVQFGVDVIAAQTEDEFIEVLRAVFGSTKAVAVVTAILSQTDPNWKYDEIPF
jgi:hypothetical protein